MDAGSAALSPDDRFHQRLTGESARTNSASRTLAVLSAFDQSRAVLGVSEVASHARVPKSTAHRLLAVLIDHGYVKRDGNRYRLDEHVFELGSRALRPQGLRERAVPFMAELHHQTLETVHLAVLHDGHVLYLEKIFGHRAPPCPTVVGGRNPAHSTALGKAILSQSAPDAVARVVTGELARLTTHTITNREALCRSLDRARDEGVALDLEESRLGLACVAAPIVDSHTGEAVAALSISSPTSRFDERRLAARLRKVADALSRICS
ncbi:IclR family transcriptional regulator [Pseudonocardia acidicola]|uniref:IclR family transcriptional regulator n=1 Tax=Pseudonocardia acidicola TaxID=2724939 RepID=A0ABX1SA59_9PSEU|nr:IclR family transcriptional regulator [Pseudonocardia acidicola]NMH97353.1 IclR family transcriptional regulator [Pseudonocardia acidicola]